MIVCPDCSRPVLPTMVFNQAEYYCPSCKHAFGLLDVASVADSAELVEEKVALSEQYEPFLKQCIAYGMKRMDCDKCNQGEYHRDHATTYEVLASDRAYQILAEGIR